MIDLLRTQNVDGKNFIHKLFLRFPSALAGFLIAFPLDLVFWLILRP